MRKKESFGVTEGLEFNPENIVDTGETILIPQKKSKRIIRDAEIDPNRNYSPYYTPKPKQGSKGGILGRGSVKQSERKVQISLTCTPKQKELFLEAAKKDARNFPSFICKAVEEHIENHNLL